MSKDKHDPKQNIKKKSKVLVNENYETKYGFHMPENYVYKSEKGLNEEVVRQISAMKGEPEWMTTFRLNAYKTFLEKPLPMWGADLTKIDFDNIYYYLKPLQSEKKTWADVPDEMKETFERLGVPQAEREFLSGIKAQYDSEVIYGSLRKELEDDGVIFMGTDEALKKYPHFFKEYFGKIIPPNDNKFAALNSAVWSGGSFVYIPKGVTVKRPLQAYFRINAQNMGQFERTLIVADEGSYGHYVEGCFTKGHTITLKNGYKNIEDVNVGDEVLTHVGRYKKVHHIQKRPYTGDLYKIDVWGIPAQTIEVTEEHPFLFVSRKLANERNKIYNPEWIEAKNLAKKGYLAMPINKVLCEDTVAESEIIYKKVIKKIKLPLRAELFRLIGYYLAEGSIEDRGYIRFSFNSEELNFVDDVKYLMNKVFGINKYNVFNYKDRAGIELVFSSAEVARVFKVFGSSSVSKCIPDWVVSGSLENQKELIKGYFRGDGNYYNKINKHGRKELFRINTTSPVLVLQIRDILLRLGILSFINKRNREKELRKDMFTLGITGEYMIPFGKIVGIEVNSTINSHKRATSFFIDKNYAYLPIKKIEKRKVENVDVFNFSVEEDESYVANSVAVHNCTAPVFSSDSLHAAVVEVIVKKGARFRYTTIQNWSQNVYNLVTKRARVESDAVMEWIDGNLGSTVTMKYPSCYLVGERAHGEVLSIAYAGNKNQHQDAGAKMFHFAPNTSSMIVSKSVSVHGGRTSYRGMVSVTPSAKNAKSRVECDALILDSESRSDTYPTMKINESSANIEHEATVSKVGEEKLFYLMSRGLTEAEAMSLIVSGFIEPIVKELPMEYAVELNRLIELEMEGSVG